MAHAQPSNKSNITLIGMPGVGKTTLGKVLARQLNYQFLDTDTLIQAKTGHPLQDLLNQEGEAAFLDIEKKVVLDQINLNNTIISPGGSVIYTQEAMHHLKAISTIIYLKDTFENIQKRIPNLNSRGIVGLGGKTLFELFQERELLYEKYADNTVLLVGKSSNQIGQELRSLCE